MYYYEIKFYSKFSVWSKTVLENTMGKLFTVNVTLKIHTLHLLHSPVQQINKSRRTL